DALKKNGVDKNTLVIFTSDNGPWVAYGNHAGKTPFREAKATSFDGGTRSACIMKFPGQIPAGKVSDQAFCTIDLLPTISHITGAELPVNDIDGMDVTDIVMSKPGAVNPHDYYAFSIVDHLEVVMTGDGHWKLHLPHNYRSLAVPGKDGLPGKYDARSIGLSLFDMKDDPGETTNVILQHPDIAIKLQKFADQHLENFYNEPE
ncbi:MAG TPA: sulfatase-like hydrolase/transferase, partial [Bacteroidales bacterium]|nr:sulfatase-like hydrolase/transferase [Bacteroidales bacterium]